jgi:hypothetical protein
VQPPQAAFPLTTTSKVLPESPQAPSRCGAGLHSGSLQWPLQGMRVGPPGPGPGVRPKLRMHRARVRAQVLPSGPTSRLGGLPVERSWPEQRPSRPSERRLAAEPEGGQSRATPLVRACSGSGRVCYSAKVQGHEGPDPKIPTSVGTESLKLGFSLARPARRLLNLGLVHRAQAEAGI